MKKLNKLILLFLILANGYLFAFEKVGTTSFQFLKVISSARGAGMGEAFSTIASGSDAVFFNPVQLTNRTTSHDLKFVP